jgi:3-hydroxybutyryl-CoA dehydratase
MINNPLKAVRIAVTQDLINQYAFVSDDFNPIHTDPEFAAATPLGGIIAHGTLSLNLIWQSLEETFGNERGDLVISNVRFKLPVRVDDRLEAGGKCQHDGSILVWVKNQNDQNVIDGFAQLRRGTDNFSDT